MSLRPGIEASAPLDSRLHVGATVKVLDCHADGRGFKSRAGAFICQKKSI